MHGIIYKIENTSTGKIYIGQSCSKYKTKRWRDHLSNMRKGKHNNPHMQRAYNLYGEESFIYSELDKASSQEELDILELYYIKCYDSLDEDKGYNILIGGKGGPMPESVKYKISLANKGRGFGRKLSASTRQRISLSNKGRIISNSTRKKIGAANSISLKGKVQPPHLIEKRIAHLRKKVICVETNVIYESIVSAYTSLNIHRTSISECLNGRRKTAGGYHWKYYEE